MITRGARILDASASTASAAMFASARSRLGQLVVAQIGLPDVDRDAVVGGVPLGRLDRLRVEVERQHGLEAELRGRDREHAGAAADVEHAAPLLGLEQLEAELRRRMPAGAERAARIDHDRDRVPVRLLPRRADPEPADADGLVELPPAVLPVLLDVGDARRRRTPARSAPRRRRSCRPRSRARRRRRSPRSPPGRARASPPAPARPERRER